MQETENLDYQVTQKNTLHERLKTTSTFVENDVNHTSEPISVLNYKIMSVDEKNSYTSQPLTKFHDDEDTC